MKKRKVNADTHAFQWTRSGFQGDQGLSDRLFPMFFLFFLAVPGLYSDAQATDSAARAGRGDELRDQAAHIHRRMLNAEGCEGRAV